MHPDQSADRPRLGANSERVARRIPLVSARCTGCGRCVGACEPRVLSLEARGWEKSAALHDAGGCTGCSRCAVVCPFGAIRMHAVKAI